MSETTPCPDCGSEYKSVKMHIARSDCSEEPDAEAEPTGSATVFTASNKAEETVLERTGGDCERCGEAGCVFHVVREGGPVSSSNLFVLCGECDERLDGLYHQSKKSLVRFD